MKKTAALIMVILLTVGIAGCNQSNDSTGGTNSQAEDGIVVKADGTGMPALPNNTLSITVSIPTFGSDPAGTEVQLEWEKRMEAYLGCQLDIDWTYTPWADYRANEKVILASGSLPDVFTYSWGDAIHEYGEDGQVLNLADYEAYLTNYKTFINGSSRGRTAAFNADGSAYYFRDGFVNEEDITGAQSFTSFAYRFDLLKDNGLTPATTLDEFTELCATLKEAYPEAYVMSNSDKNYAFYRGFVGIFHTWDTLYWNGNEWAFGPIEDNFKEMLRYLNTLYEAGYIDPEFVTDDGDASSKKAATGKVLIYPTLWSGMVRYWNSDKESDEIEFGLAYLPEEAEYGRPWKWGSKEAGLSLAGTGLGIAISADVDYPEWIVKMVDYQYSPEMIELLNWGIKDVTYTVDSDGNKSFKDEILNADDPVQILSDYGVASSFSCRTGIVFTPQDFKPQIQQMPSEPWWSEDEGYYEDKYWIASSKIGGEGSISPFDRAPTLNLSPDESTEKAILVNACETVAKEKAVEFIVGSKDIDADWDDYINSIIYAVDDFYGTLDMLNENSILE